MFVMLRHAQIRLIYVQLYPCVTKMFELLTFSALAE